MVFISIFDAILGTGDIEIDGIPYHYLLRKTDNIHMKVNMYTCVYKQIYKYNKYQLIIDAMIK